MNAESIFNIKYNGTAPDKGMMLISEPLTNDIFFGRSAILLAQCVDNEEYLGFITNKLLDITIEEIFDTLSGLNLPVYMGGPCEPDSIFFIHRLDHLMPNSKHIAGDMYWSIDMGKAIELNNLGILNADNIRFFIGYSGWQVTQLHNELRRNQWLVADYQPSLFWHSHYELIWKQYVKSFSPQYDRWLMIPENPNYN